MRTAGKAKTDLQKEGAGIHRGQSRSTGEVEAVVCAESKACGP
jgi:hypothetical protein